MRGQVKRAPRVNGMHEVWTLQAGRPVAISVQTGATDGVDTEILSGDLKAGTALIVDGTAARS
jgi:HlyD family secretion protein